MIFRGEIMKWIKSEDRIDNLDQVESFKIEKNELVMYIRDTTRVVLRKYKTKDDALEGLNAVQHLLASDNAVVVLEKD